VKGLCLHAVRSKQYRLYVTIQINALSRSVILGMDIIKMDLLTEIIGMSLIIGVVYFLARGAQNLGKRVVQRLGWKRIERFFTVPSFKEELKKLDIPEDWR
jgi:hypothetical protein